MASSIFERILDTAVPFDGGATLTVTEVPEREEDLLKLLDRAMLRGFRNHAPLTQIHLPLERFPYMESKFWHIPVEDCGEAQVLRFFFEAPDVVAQ